MGDAAKTLREQFEASVGFVPNSNNGKSYTSWDYEAYLEARAIIAESRIAEMRQFTEAWLERAKIGDIVPSGLDAYPVWRQGNVIELIVWGSEPQPYMKGWHVYVIMVSGRVYAMSSTRIL